MGWAKAPLWGWLLRASVPAAEHRDPAPGGPGWGRGPPAYGLPSPVASLRTLQYAARSA